MIKLIKKLQEKLENLDIPFEYQYEFHPDLLKKINNESNLNDPFEKDNFIPAILTIKYPNIIIKNNKNKSKYLGDIYAVFSIQFNSQYENNQDTINFNLLHVVRSEYNYKDLYHIEKLKHNSFLYTHSHLSSRLISSTHKIECFNEFNTLKETNYTFDKICLGSSILANKIKFMTIEELPEVVFLYKKFFEWESLEGTPYVVFSAKENYSNSGNAEVYLSTVISNYINKDNIRDFINYTTVDLDTIIYDVVDLNGINLHLNKKHLKNLINDLNIIDIEISNTTSFETIGYDYIIKKNCSLDFKNELLKSNNLKSIIKSFNNLGIIFKGEKINPILKIEEELNSIEKSKELDNLIELILNKFGNGEELIITIPLNNNYIIKLFVITLINNLIKTNEFYV